MMLSSLLRVLPLVWSLTGFIHCVQVTLPNPAINVTAGQSATLYCTYTLSESNTKNLLIQWKFLQPHSHDPVPVYFLQNGQSYTEGRFKNRVTASNATGNATITISNMQPQDTGFYICEVSNLPDPSGQAQLQLIVQVAPSTPNCNIEGNIASEHVFKLSCKSNEGNPRPVYTWSRILNGVSKPLNLEQGNGLVTIGNMTKFEDGYYQCTASNFLGNATCQVDLHTGGEAGIIVGGIIGAVLLATIIFVIIWFVIAKRKNKKHISNSEMKTISSSGGQSYPAQGEAEEPARQNLVVSEPPETKEYRDQPDNVTAANGEVEDPAV
ncbi:V-set and immunoglobulin domain-containing protein 1 [Mixophyes fleayi]|uniref:V-set and immunoglobulin domain-containing protein 1 n=1 Tax=Mixophyes fleayi TaxID=3061075 RepID=UPI003F4DB6FD